MCTVCRFASSSEGVPAPAVAHNFASCYVHNKQPNHFSAAIRSFYVCEVNRPDFVDLVAQVLLVHRFFAFLKLYCVLINRARRITPLLSASRPRFLSSPYNAFAASFYYIVRCSAALVVDQRSKVFPKLLYINLRLKKPTLIGASFFTKSLTLRFF